MTRVFSENASVEISLRERIVRTSERVQSGGVSSAWSVRLKKKAETAQDRTVFMTKEHVCGERNAFPGRVVLPLLRR
jgi:hypothetical protein